MSVAAVRPREPDKIAAMRWEGDDAAWDAALAPFKLNLDFGPSGVGKPAAKAEPEADTSAPKGLLSRLFSR